MKEEIKKYLPTDLIDEDTGEEYEEFEGERVILVTDHNKALTEQKKDYNHIIKTLEYRIKKLKEQKENE